jgi:uncharacterized glyoxalase superfamily protein PhnB
MSETTSGTTPPAKTIWPTFAYADARAALSFLVEAFGFEETLVVADEDYGSRGFTVRDPEGVYWSFGTYHGA